MAQRLHRPPQEKVDVSHGKSLARLLLARNGQPVAGEISTENHVMALVINTNIASIQSERALATNRGSMEQAMQRLSSGMRINSAIDDAAGIAVTQQIRGMAKPAGPRCCFHPVIRQNRSQSSRPHAGIVRANPPNRLHRIQLIGRFPQWLAIVSTSLTLFL